MSLLQKEHRCAINCFRKKKRQRQELSLEDLKKESAHLAAEGAVSGLECSVCRLSKSWHPAVIPC